MCGIAGEIRFTKSASEANWPHISALMERRGPDDDGIWDLDDHCTLAFRRLAILDLSLDGHQPMVAKNEKFVLVFNGEVYSFPKIRRDLEHEGIRCRSTGDTEVVLKALMTWGRDALSRFDGMFALAFYDRRKKRLLLARDHVGIKPLYVLRHRRGLVFASQYDQILAHPFSRDLEVDRDALGLYLRLAYVPAPMAIMQDTQMLEPGCWLEAGADGEIETGRHYAISWERSPDLYGDEALEAVDSAITASVKRHLISDVPLGAFLSGGVDSPLIVAKIRECEPDLPVRTFTIATGETNTDESEDARQYAQAMGVEQVVEHASPGQALGLLKEVIEACGEPFGDYSIFPTMLVTQLASREFKVMLSGDGGDEPFWGYIGRAAEMIERAPAFRSPYLVRRLRRRAKQLFRIGDPRADPKWPTIGHWQRQRHTHLANDLLVSIFPELPDWPVSYDAYDCADSDPDRTARWLRQNEIGAHLPMVLLKVDRASMYNSLEVRVPLLDKEVLEVASRVDWRTCMDSSSRLGKLPLRKCLQRRVSFQTHQKRGFAIPMGTWLRTSLRREFEDRVLSRKELLGLEVNRRALGDLFKRHQDGQADLGWGLWPLLSLCLWADKFAPD